MAERDYDRPDFPFVVILFLPYTAGIIAVNCRLSLVARKNERVRHRRRRRRRHPSSRLPFPRPVRLSSSLFICRLTESATGKPPLSLVDSLFLRGSDISPRSLSPTRRRDVLRFPSDISRVSQKLQNFSSTKLK